MAWNDCLNHHRRRRGGGDYTLHPDTYHHYLPGQGNSSASPTSDAFPFIRCAMVSPFSNLRGGPESSRRHPVGGLVGEQECRIDSTRTLNLDAGRVFGACDSKCKLDVGQAEFHKQNVKVVSPDSDNERLLQETQKNTSSSPLIRYLPRPHALPIFGPNVSSKLDNNSEISRDTSESTEHFTVTSTVHLSVGRDSRDSIINKSEGSRSSGEMSWCKKKSGWRGTPHASNPSTISSSFTPLTTRSTLPESHSFEPGFRKRVSSTRYPPSLVGSEESSKCRSSSSPWLSLHTQSRLFVLALFVLVALPVATNALTGPNVCTKQETYTSLVNVSMVKAYRVRSYTFCLSIPPKCSKYKINYKTVYKTQSQTKKRTVDVCCSGYTRVTAEDRCIPICSHDCLHGVCVKPDQCRCEAGFSGPSCNITCPEGKWGMGCIHDCPCLHEGKCDPLYGNCSCHAGWIGQYCEERCPQQHYGMDCKDQCRCQHGGTCDHISGACLCPPGWTGPLCEKMCPEGTHGNACSNKCQCQNGGSCDPIDGKCLCPQGWTGDVCANPCPVGTWGANCSEQCDCYNGATCDHVTGRCKCTAGFLGNKCQKECPLGTYGVNCTEVCSCSNEATCSHISGRCFCQKGWLGPVCDQPACPPNQYGESCSKMCSCEAASTERCHPWTGECECKPGWAGITCSRACPFYKYGEKCSQSCKCKNGAFCNPILGNCTCAPGYHGVLCEEVCPVGKYGQYCKLDCRCTNGNGCNHETGKCICHAGWEGLQCAVTCPDGFYGTDCKEKCECMFGGACHPETGECTCGPGHLGERCEQTCEQGMHGTNCDYHCACVGPNVEGCDPETGKCLCKPGFRGVSCESRCPRGYYGENCNKRCDCRNEGSCHPQTGKCICERGWNGADCNTPCRTEKHGVNCNQDCPTCLHGNGTCEHTSGACVCSSGWRGQRCARTCPPGNWGVGCTRTCQCRNGGECRPETGECVCLPGWRGRDCSEPCEHDFFGYNCLQPCHCRNHASCRGNDGFCECLPGWMGPGCTQTCPEGYFGRQCLNVCNCRGNNFICHPVEGCKCRNGFEGDECDQPIMSNIVDVNMEALPPSGRSSSNSAGIIAGVVFIIVFTVIISVVLYYRRRVKSLKRELAVVQYTANPGTSDRPSKLSREPSLKEQPPAPPPPPVAAAAKARASRLSLKGGPERPETVQNSRMSDQHHFDNPVYAYQPVSKSQPNLNENGVATGMGNGGSGLNTIHNNLHHNHHKDTNNRHWDKLGNFTFDDEAASSVGAVASQHYDVPGSSSRKAWEADATNPNLYHSIENLKDNRMVDHVYDEIKQKTPPHQREPDGEYDRLTYSRPVGEVKRHYYRMPSSLLTHPALPPVPTTPHSTTPLPLLPHPHNPPLQRIPPTPSITSTSTTTSSTTTTSKPTITTPLTTHTSSTHSSTIQPPHHPIFSTTTTTQPRPTFSTRPLATATTVPLPTSTSSAIISTNNSAISSTTNSNSSTTSAAAMADPLGAGEGQGRCSLTPSTDSSNECNVTSSSPPSFFSSPSSIGASAANGGFSGAGPMTSPHELLQTRLSHTGSDNGGKVSNLQPNASEDVYATQKLNNLDLSLDGPACGGGKRDAYNKFDDDRTDPFHQFDDDFTVKFALSDGIVDDDLFRRVRADDSPDGNTGVDMDDEDLLPAVETDTEHTNSEAETEALNVSHA